MSSSRYWAATVLVTAVAALISAIFKATTAATIFGAAAILSAILLAVDPWARKLLDKWIPDLKVTIEKMEWENFRYQALILEMKVTIKNRKNKRKRLTKLYASTRGWRHSSTVRY